MDCSRSSPLCPGPEESWSPSGVRVPRPLVPRVGRHAPRVSPFRAEPRSLGTTSAFGRDPAPGPMGRPAEHSEVREIQSGQRPPRRAQPGRVSCSSAGRHGTLGHDHVSEGPLPSIAPGAYRHPARPSGRAVLGAQMPMPRLVEVFSGAGQLSRSARRRGWRTTESDIRHGHDLRRPEWAKGVAQSLQHASAVHFATPCASFFCARRHRPLRSSRHPWGLPDLSRVDRANVRDGNLLLARSVALIRQAVQLGCLVSLENPQSSALWRMPSLRPLLSSADLVNFDQCQYGTPWKKPTSVALWNAPAAPGLARRCVPRGPLCAASGRPHRRLEGRAPGGTPWAAIAQA